MKSKLKSKSPSAADVRVLDLRAQATARQAEEDKAGLKRVRARLKLAKAAAKKARKAFKDSCHVARKARKAWKEAASKRRKDAKKAARSTKLNKRSARPKSPAKAAQSPVRATSKTKVARNRAGVKPKRRARLKPAPPSVRRISKG
jgi:hypothetical protein